MQIVITGTPVAEYPHISCCFILVLHQVLTISAYKIANCNYAYFSAD